MNNDMSVWLQAGFITIGILMFIFYVFGSLDQILTKQDVIIKECIKSAPSNAIDWYMDI